MISTLIMAMISMFIIVTTIPTMIGVLILAVVTYFYGKKMYKTDMKIHYDLLQIYNKEKSGFLRTIYRL